MLLDYELIGDLQVSNGIVSGFNNSTNNYIKIPYSLPMGSNKVELCLSLYYPELSSSSVILANYNDSSSGGGLVLRSQGSYDNIRYWAWNSSGTMIAENIDLGFDLTIGTNIIKFIYENSTITWYKSTDGINFTQGISRSGTIADFQNYITIGASGTVWSSGNMQVNMLDSYIKLNDEYWHSKEYIKQKTRIIQRHDTAANWTTINPVLALGEMGVETDTNKFKFGDGTTTYNELPYAAGEGGGTGGSGTTITSKNGTTSYNKLALGDGLIVDTGDIPWTNPQMSSNSQDGYILTSSANNTSDGQSNMYRAFDKDTTTPDYCWYTGNVSMPQWIMLECPEPVKLTSCMIMNEITSPVNFKSGYIQGSNDGSTFDNLYTITDRPNTTGLQVTYTFDNNTCYKYLRVYCTESYGSGLSIQEIEFKGFVKSALTELILNVNTNNIYTKEQTDLLLADKQDKLTAGDGIDISLKYTNAFLPQIALPYTFTSENTTVFTSNQMLEDGAEIYFKVSQESIGSFIAIKESGDNGVAFQVRNNVVYSHYRVGGSDDVIASSSTVSVTQGIYYKIKYHNGSLLELFYSLDGINYIPIGTWTGYGSNFYNHDIYMVAEPRHGGGDCTVTKLEQAGDTSNSILTISSTVSVQDIKKFTGYSDTGTLVLKSINGVLQWVAEA